MLNRTGRDKNSLPHACCSQSQTKVPFCKTVSFFPPLYGPSWCRKIPRAQVRLPFVLNPKSTHPEPQATETAALARTHRMLILKRFGGFSEPLLFPDVGASGSEETTGDTSNSSWFCALAANSSQGLCINELSLALLKIFENGNPKPYF